MSSRKRKKNTSGSVPAAEATEKTDSDSQLEVAEPAVAASVDSGDEGLETAEPDASLYDESTADDARPAVSEISELRPRDTSLPSDGPEDAVVSESASEGEPAADGVAAQAAPTTRAHLKRLVESLIFVSDQIISAQQIARIVKAKQAEVRELVVELSAEYEGRGIELVEVAGGYQFRSAAASAPFVRDLVAQRPVRLTRAQLETLALIAYRQPITRPEIDDVRGVDSGSAIKVLLERDLVKILGRKDEAGRPLLYGTAPYFLEFFSMKGMQDLPTLREFTELNEEHRELFQRKTGEIPDLSTEAFMAPEYIDPEDEAPVAPVSSESLDAAVAATDVDAAVAATDEDAAVAATDVDAATAATDADTAEEPTTSEHSVMPEIAAPVDQSEA